MAAVATGEVTAAGAMVVEGQVEEGKAAEATGAATAGAATAGAATVGVTAEAAMGAAKVVAGEAKEGVGPVSLDQSLKTESQASHRGPLQDPHEKIGC